LSGGTLQRKTYGAHNDTHNAIMAYPYQQVTMLILISIKIILSQNKN